MGERHLVDIVVPWDCVEDESVCRVAVAESLKVDADRIKSLKLRKRSIDARGRTIRGNLRFEVGVDEVLGEDVILSKVYPLVKEGAKRVVIVGFGPAGMFAAVRCLQLGLKPVVVERGKTVSERRFDLAPLMREGRVVEDSNYCFGEGGAGTFSDGKLYTRATKRGNVREVLDIFVAHGAPPEILIDAHPHIGSNLLPNVVKSIRESIVQAGGEVHFETKMTGLLRSPDGRSMRGIVTSAGCEIEGEAVILATGHSARDVYALLAEEGIAMEAKAFAVGVRIEHSQAYIDGLQYHLRQGDKRPYNLPAARYALATKIEGRGVHTFCMCPGGFIVPAATENDEVVVNGMSLSRRDSPFANAGFVVTVEPEDTQDYRRENGVLAGVAFQKALEQLASRAGGGVQRAPGQKVVDFMRNRESRELLPTSYHPGIRSAPIHELLPPFIVKRMQVGLKEFSQKMPGYAGEEALFVGFETRTSSPVRIPRDSVSLQHVDVKGLFPCAEGAGYAGGIVSAAMDGMHCVEGVARFFVR